MQIPKVFQIPENIKNITPGFADVHTENVFQTAFVTRFELLRSYFIQIFSKNFIHFTYMESVVIVRHVLRFFTLCAILYFVVNKPSAKVCEMEVNEENFQSLKYAVDNHYWYQMYIGMLAVYYTVLLMCCYI